MKKTLQLLIILFFAFTSHAQLLSWSPQFPGDNSTITITVDATKGNQALKGYTGTVYMHLGVITNLSTTPGDWKYVPTTWASTTAPVATSLGSNKWSFIITNPRAYFNSGAGGVPAGETILKIALLFRDAAGNLVQKNADGSDMYVPIYAAGSNHIQFTTPLIVPTNTISHEPITATINQTVAVAATASTTTGILNLYYNGTKITGPLSGVATITGNALVTATGNQQLISELVLSGVSYYDTVNFYIAPVTVVAPLPSGAVEGINYASNCTSVTLVLYAPNKSDAMVIGDFAGSNWMPQAAFQMNKTPDGNYYWLTINGLASGQEYAFEYVVDNAIYVADPYSEKILDPANDQYIPAATYPALKPYPVNVNVSAGKNGIVSVLQTCAPAYNWQVTNFTKPDKRNLITYELLVRDFGDARNYQMLIDTVGYFKRLGINAIELMPVNEFTGNESWGYNPTFYCALDKAYGTKNKFKEFIDLCHQNGIAIILDAVYNHMDAYSNPQGRLYWDATAGIPAANSPWFNQNAPHPYSVFNDLNHTTTATQYLVERSMEYWLKEYKVDGFRLDLAKGFTQTQSSTTTVENYDATRVANLNRYYDYIVPKFPGTYMILEFLGQQRQEEQEYATKGFILWGNNNATYNQNTMGYASNADFSKIVYNSTQGAFTTPSEMGYMESHDEERLMYKNEQYGNIAGGYNVKTVATALDRQAAAAAVFFTVPGPKMFWQFGERGYDISLGFGGSNVANKPPHWEYMADADRLKLWNAYAQLIKLRLNNPAVFNNPSFTYDFNDNNGLFRKLQIADPLAAGIKVTVIANLDVLPQTRTISFQSAGDWNNYLSNGTGTGLNGITGNAFNLTAATQSITLQPGEYHVYVSVPTCATVAPTATSPVNYCQNAVAASLTATGTNLLWYTTATGGTGTANAPIPVTSTTGSTNYYVTQTNGCESSRLPVTVNISATTPVPVITTPVNYCKGVTPVALTATGTGLLWYTTATGGTGSATAPVPSTVAAGTTIFYVTQTLSCGESSRAAITVNISPVPAAPVVATPVMFCQNTTAVALTATGTSLLWYAAPTGGTGNTAAPVPGTAITGNAVYYVTQAVNGCESERATITATVKATPAIPLVTSSVTYCQNATASGLSATGTSLLWYTAATGGSGIATAPVPSTAAAGTVSYYVSQTNNGCESPRASITVNTTALPATPVVVEAVAYCQHENAAVLSATGTDLLWYTVATGGVGSSVAIVPSTEVAGNTTYYVSERNNCGESGRAEITVTVKATPAPPTALAVSDVTLTAAHLSWAALPGIFYSVDYKAIISSSWINVLSNSTAGSIAIENLSPATTYDWRVSANCTGIGAGNFSNAQFTTASRNNTITNLKDGFGLKISPDPAAGEVVIDYLVPGSGKVTLSLITSLGQRIQRLFSGTQNQGQYQLILPYQLKGINSGNYFIQLEQNGKSHYIHFIKK
ncbi:alpha-amylase family glycosyl hydrolase [Ferruginibacter paludis]|uniref:Ig-like domain-containing protein n=1 Tax=Ferruginibacter paludis TaxID=1310417 RepID=UPI0025B439C4|nr:alpha-amylase family glycosyl hydrolase [Ferruginibacter paludis]MDN3659261.1 alpha-amylase family glycosyl hydrolase [Ferruginibacter paludis]